MTSIKNISFKKKIAAITLAAVVAIVPVMSGIFASVDAHADESALSIGDIVAFDERGYVCKDTICVKRWHKYYFTLYYMGTYDNVFVTPVREAKFITSYYTYTLDVQDMQLTSYNLTTQVSEEVTEEFSIQSKINFPEFLDNAKAHIKVDQSYKQSSAVSVTESITYTVSRLVQEKYDIKVIGDEKSPFNHYYGDMLMMARANKFKLTVSKKQEAKHRKSALHKWGAYQEEMSWPEKQYVFYSSYYNSSANFYRMIGDLGTHDEYINLITNEGK